MKHQRIVTPIVIFAALLVISPAVSEAQDRVGALETVINGERVYMPLLRADMDVDLHGDIADVTVTQTFNNTAGAAIHATYLFPIFEDAAVYAMAITIGDRRIEAQIQRSEKARETFQKAKREGKQAALLTQHRPNMFTQDIANLMPGVPIKVELRYTHVVDKVDGEYVLTLPLGVGERYHSPNTPNAPGAKDPTVAAGTAPNKSGVAYGKWEIEQKVAQKQSANATLRNPIDPERVSIDVNLHGPTAITASSSITHALATTKVGAKHWRLSLAQGRTIDNRDFELRYTFGAGEIGAGALTFRDETGGYLSVLLEPPPAPRSDQITAREMVFVLDCSGSMRGAPLDASKTFVRTALRQLRPSDSFRIVRFSDAASTLSKTPLAATPENIQRGIAYVDRLNSTGGTEMTSGIIQALEPTHEMGVLRIVNFLTDGYIGNDATVLQLIKRHLGESRMYALGVGASVNRYLLTEMGRAGRGTTRFIRPHDDAQAVATRFATELETPVLTNISVDWGQLAVQDPTPDPIPDLFAGQSVRVMARTSNPPGTWPVTVRGLVHGKPASLEMQVTIPEQSQDGSGIARIWARSTINTLQHKLLEPRARGAALERRNRDDAIKKRVTTLGIDYGLVTPWTSFVAVDHDGPQNNDPLLSDHEDVALPSPASQGANPLQHAVAANNAPQAAFNGHSTPEPATVGGLILAAVALGGAFAKRRRRRRGGEDEAI